MPLVVDIDWEVDVQARVLKKFGEFAVDNYEPVKEQPEYDDREEVVAQVEGQWYGPILFEDMTTFAFSLPEDERRWLIAALRGEEQSTE